MKIPKTTKSKPYICFRFNRLNNLKLSISSDWWGGFNSGFSSSDGSIGNTCLPKDLNKAIDRFKQREIKEIDKEIKKLETKKQKLIEKFNL